MSTFPPPIDTDTRPLPDGWIAEYDPNKEKYYFVDTLSLNPTSTWDDPRDNPALFVDVQPTDSAPHSSSKGPKLASVAPGPRAPPTLQTYPDYPPNKSNASGLLALAGAVVAAGMIHRAGSD